MQQTQLKAAHPLAAAACSGEQKRDLANLGVKRLGQLHAQPLFDAACRLTGTAPHSVKKRGTPQGGADHASKHSSAAGQHARAETAPRWLQPLPRELCGRGQRRRDLSPCTSCSSAAGADGDGAGASTWLRAPRKPVQPPRAMQQHQMLISAGDAAASEMQQHQMLHQMLMAQTAPGPALSRHSSLRAHGWSRRASRQGGTPPARCQHARTRGVHAWARAATGEQALEGARAAVGHARLRNAVVRLTMSGSCSLQRVSSSDDHDDQVD